LAKTAIARRPAGDALWHLHGFLSLQAGDHLSALASLKQAWRRQGGTAMYVAYHLAEILCRRRRYKLALEMAEFACRAGLKWEGLQPLLAEINLGLGRGEACLSNLAASRTPVTGDYWTNVRNIAQSMVANEYRHIAIGGASYTGSTVLGMTLGSLPGCGHIGESQELVFLTDTATGVYRRMEQSDSADQLVHCRICGPGCKVLSHDFRTDLAADPVDWYLKLARRMSVRTLISSDKFATQYQLADPLHRYDLIIVYKGLESWVSSFRRQEDQKKKLGISSLESPDPKVWLDAFTLNYANLVKTIQPTGRRVVLSWEQFVSKPKQHFEHLATLLRLSGDSSVFNSIRIDHLIGGNDTPSVRAIIEAKRVQFKQSDAPPLSPADRTAIAAHKPAQRMVRMLDMLHAQSFGTL
jgi:hypothetical protein